MRSFTRTQLCKTTHRNKKKTRRRRNKRTKNARGGSHINMLFIKDGKDDIYTGQTNDANLPHGKGTMVYKDSKGRPVIYVGEWKLGKMHGLGKKKFVSEQYKNLATIEGFWENDNLAKGPYKKTIETGSVWVGRLLDNGKSEGEWFDGTVERMSDCNQQTCLERRKCANLGTVTYHDENTKYYVYPRRDLCDPDKGVLIPLALSNAVYAQDQYNSALTSRDISHISQSALEGFKNTKNMQKEHWKTVSQSQRMN